MPFTGHELLETFARYNQAFGPMWVVLTGLALVMVGLAGAGRVRCDRVIALFLASVWAWMAIAFHLAFFAAINPAAPLFAGLFLLQAALLAWAGLRERPVRFHLREDLRSAAALAFVAHALLGYPLVSRLVGHVYPAAPMFGLPCPTTLFTTGLLLAARPFPAHLAIVPVIWSITGWSGAWQLGMVEDHALAASALALMATGVRERVRRLPASPAGAGA
jgi:hypothetical protein